MLRFALHRQGRDSQACTRCQAMACRGSLRVPQPKKHNRFGCRLPEVNAQPCTQPRKGSRPRPNNRVLTLGVSR